MASLESDNVLIFQNRNCKFSVPNRLHYSVIYSIVSVFETGTYPNVLDYHVAGIGSLERNCHRDLSKVRSSSDIKFSWSAATIPHLLTGGSLTFLTFGITYKLFIPILLLTTFSDALIKLMYSAKTKHVYDDFRWYPT